jgi:hypothetical protein
MQYYDNDFWYLYNSQQITPLQQLKNHQYIQMNYCLQQTMFLFVCNLQHIISSMLQLLKILISMTVAQQNMLQFQ